MADTRDLKSLAKYLAYGFESRLRHFLIRLKPRRTDASIGAKSTLKNNLNTYGAPITTRRNFANSRFAAAGF